MELSSVLSKVQKLVALAEHDGTPREEADRAREMADALMLQYSIEEAMLDRSRPQAVRLTPSVIEVAVSGDGELAGYVGMLLRYVAEHCRCQVRLWTGWSDGARNAKVYGFESDLGYFNVLYTTLRLHMIGAFDMKPDPEKSLEDNAYRLHNIGLNWLGIAEAYGWRKSYWKEGDPVGKPIYQNKVTGERATNTDLGAIYGHAYMRAIKARGETRIKIPAGGAATYRRSAAQGYALRIGQRLRDLRSKREPGGELVLKDRADDLSAFFREQNADLFEERPECEACKKAKSGHCRQHPRGAYRPLPYSSDGYRAGVRRANEASLNPEAGSGRPGRELGR